MTHTYAILQVSRRAWDEIHMRLMGANYTHVYSKGDILDMHGIALQPLPPTEDSHFTPVPDFAKDYPEQADSIDHVRLPFYCCNCLQKRPTRYLTPNFGLFCAECLREFEKGTT